MAKSSRGSRWTGWLNRRRSVLRPFPALRAEELELRDVPASFTWSGAGSDNNWSTAANWVGGVAPTGVAAAADDLVFQQGPLQRLTNNDIPNGVFNSITFSTTTPNQGYTLTGNSLTLGRPGVPGSGRIIVNTGSTGNTLQIDTQLGASASNNQFFTVNAGADLVITGRLSGNTGTTLTKQGTGTLTLAADNSGFTGPIELDTASGVVIVSHPNALGTTTAPTTVRANSSLRVARGTGTINEPLRLNGPGVSSDGALINLGGTNVWAGTVTLDSNVTIGGIGLTDEVQTVQLVATGPSPSVTLSFNGQTTAPIPLPTTAAAIQAALNGLSTIAPNSVTVTGSGSLFTVTFGGGALAGVNQPPIVAVGTNATATVAEAQAGGAPGILDIAGQVVDTGAGFNLTKEGQGEIRLSFINGTGTAGNTYRGQTFVNSGILTITNPYSLGAQGSAANGTVVNSFVTGQGQLRLQSGGADFTVLDEVLTLNGAGQAGLLNRGSLTNTGGNNTWAGPIILGSPAPNGVDVTIGTGSGTLTVSGVVSSPNKKSDGFTPYTLTKLDAGTLIFNNANTYDGQTLIQEGTLAVRDSNALGTNAVFVSNVGTLRLDVEAGIPGAALVDAHGRNLSDDSVTHDEHRLRVSNRLFISGPGDQNGGALRSATGINVWTNQITLQGTAAIGVDLDPRTGHPTPDASYFVNDYSLTTTNTIDGGNLDKVGGGQLILPVANTYTGVTQVLAGWVTVQHDDALGTYIPSLGPTVQPRTIVSDGAAVHLRTLTPASPPLNVHENITLNGFGPAGLTYRFIAGKGALMNIGGNNFYSGEIALTGTAGVGVELVEPGAASSLTVLNPNPSASNPSRPTIRDVNPLTPGGLVKLGSQRLTVQTDATYTGATEVREGTLSARHNTALGLASSGTATTQESYTTTPTTVQSGAVLTLDQSSATHSGGIASGVQITNEQLVLNKPGQQIGVAGSLTPAPVSFTLTFEGQTTTPIIPGAPAAEVATALNALSSLRRSEVQEVLVNGSAAGTFTLTFNGQTTTPLSRFSSAGTVQAALLALTSIQRSEVQTVLVAGTSGSFTLRFNGQTTAPIPFSATATDIANALNALPTVGLVGGNVTVTSAPSGSGTLFTVSFGGTLANQNLPQMTSSTVGGVAASVATTQQGLAGTVTVTRTPVPAPGTGVVFNVAFGGDLALQNLPQMSSTVSNGATALVTTVQDGRLASVAVTDGIGPGGGTRYTVTFGGDLANVDVSPITAAAVGGVTPAVSTLQDGGGAQSEQQAVDVVASDGRFTLTFNGQTTGALPITAPASQVEAALNGLTNLTTAVGLVSVRRSGNVYTVTFADAHTADINPLVATAIPAPNGTPEITVSGITTVDGAPSEASLVNLSQDNSWRGPITLNTGARVAIQGNSRLNVFGTIEDSPNPAGSALIKRGQGELLLAGLNSYGGKTWIDQGILTAANSGAFGTTASGTEVANNAQLQLQGGITVAGEPLTVRGTGVPTASTVTDQWFNVGPAPTNNGLAAGRMPTSGRITSIATDPTDPNVIYISTAGGGAWKTRDHGLTWNPLFDDTVDAAAVLYGGSLAVAYGGTNRPNIIYFATGQATGQTTAGNNSQPYPVDITIPGQRDNFAGTGVYASFDAGATWTLVTGPDSYNPIAGQAITKLVVDPLQPTRIYVATGTRGVPNASPTAIPGVYRYDGSSGTPTWVNLTANASPGRAVGGNGPGPDDDLRVGFPQSNVTWTDIILVKTGAQGRGGHPGNQMSTEGSGGTAYRLYAAFDYGSDQRYSSGTAPGNQALLNGVYRTEDPGSANPTWWLGSGTTFVVSPVSNTPTPVAPPLPNPTPVSSGAANSFPVGPITPPNPFVPPGRNGWISITGAVTNYFNEPPLNNSFPSLFNNAAVTVYASIGRPYYDPFAGQLLDIVRSAWDGGIGNPWATVATEGNFPSLPFGQAQRNTNPSTGQFFDNRIPALAGYSNRIQVQDGVPGLVSNTSNVDNVFLGGKDDLYQNTTGGSGAWTATSVLAGATQPAPYFHALFFDRTTGRLLTGSDGGIWESTGPATGVSTFNDLNGNLAITLLNAADPHPTDLNQALGASYNNGLQQLDPSPAGPAWEVTNGGAGRNAGVIRYNPQNPLEMYAVVNGVLWKTTDGGNLWSNILTVSTTSPSNGFTGENIFPLVVDEVNTSRILVGGRGGLVESVFGGAPGTFVNLNAGINPTAIAPATYQGAFVADPAFPLVVDKLSNTYDPETIYVTNGTSFRVTKDRGVSWVSRTPTMTDDRYQFTFDGFLRYKNIPQLSVTSSAGVHTTLRTVTDGDQFGPEIQELEVVRLAGTVGTFTLTVTFGGNSITLPAYAVGTPAATIANNLQTALATLAGTGNEVQTINLLNAGSSASFTLSFNGQTTGTINLPTSAGAIQAALNALSSIAPDTVSVQPAGPNRFTVTFNTGALANTDVPLMTASGSSVTVFIQETVRGGGVIVTGSRTSGSGPTYTNIAVDPSNRDTVYMTVKYANGQAGPTVLRSTDAGRTWTNVSGNLPGVQTWTAVVDPRSGVLYVGNDKGVWALADARQTSTFAWTRFGAGMPDVQVHDLQLNQNLNTLTAGTYGRGMFQLLLTDYRASSGAVRAVSGSSIWNGPVTLAGNTLITADGTQQLQNGIAAASLNIVGTISDATPGANFTLTKAGRGSLILSGSNTYGGQTLVQEGVLQVANAEALGAATPTGNTIVTAGAALELTSDLQSEQVVVNGDGILFNDHFTGALRNVSSDNVFTGTLVLGTNTTVGVNSGTSLRIGADPEGQVSGTGTITDDVNNFAIVKELPGTLILGSTNDYDGLTTVAQGAIRVEDPLALGSPGAETVVRDGTQVQISRNAVTKVPTVVLSEPLRLSGTGIFGTGALLNVRGDTDPTGVNDNTWAGPITFDLVPNVFPPTNPGSQIAVGVADSGVPGVVDTLFIDTGIQQAAGTPVSMGLIKVGPGRLTLNRANAYTGVTSVGATIGGQVLPGGSLRVRDGGSLGPTPVSQSVQTVSVVGTTGTYTLTFDGRTTIPLSATDGAAAVRNALVALSTIGVGGVTVFESPTVNGKVFTITFNRGTAPAFVPQLTGTSFTPGLAVNIATQQTGGQGVVVAAGAALELDGDPTGIGNSVSINKALTINGNGVGGGVTVTAAPGGGGSTVYTLTFGGSFGNANQPQVSATVTGGVTATVSTLQQGSGSANEVQTVTVSGTAGTFTITVNGATTAPLPFDATAQQVQDALNALTGLGGVTGALNNVSGNNTYAGPVTLGTSAAVGAAPGTMLTVPTVQDPTPLTSPDTPTLPAPQLTKGGQGTVVFTSANPYGGRTTVNDGVLAIRDPLSLGSGRNEVQTVTVNGTVGAYTLTFNGQTTVPLPFTGTTPNAAAVAAALNNLTSVRRSEIQAVTVLGTSGTFNVTFTNPLGGTETTVNLPFNVPASGGVGPTASLQNALEALSGIDPGDVTVTVGSVFGGRLYTISFGGTLAFQNLAGLTAGGQSGATASVSPVQDGLFGTADVTATTVPGGVQYTVTFLDDLADQNLPQIITAPGIVFTNTLTDGSGEGSEVQTAQVVLNSGTFTLSFGGQATAPISAGAPATGVGSVQEALLALTTIRHNEMQDIRVDGTSGTFRVSFTTGAGTFTTGDLPFNIPASGGVGPTASVQNALEALTNIGTGNVTVALQSSSAASRTFRVTFTGTLGFADQPLLSATGQNGASPTVLLVQDGLGGAPRNEQQSIQVAGTAGTFTLSFRGQTTAALPFDATATDVQTALRGLSTINGANVNVTGGPGTFTVTFVGALANANQPQITGVGSGGATVTTGTLVGGQGPILTVTRSGAAGSFLYTIAFGGDLAALDLPQLSGASGTQAGFARANTLTDGNGPETQYVQVTATNGTFTLTFDGFTTGALLFSASAADVAAALNALPSIAGRGGFVTATKAGVSTGPGGALYTVHFGGGLENDNLNIMTAATTGGTVVTITTGNDGPEGTTVTAGATLQVQGNVTMTREVVTINGSGFRQQGALTAAGGATNWQVPVFLGSNSSVGTVGATDNLIFAEPITDIDRADLAGLSTGRSLDVVGPGTVTLTGDGTAQLTGSSYAQPIFTQYTGRTTVREGTLLLDVTGVPAVLGPLVGGDAVGAADTAVVRELRNDQVADTSLVTVNSDGRFDLNGFADAIDDLSVVGGTVLTGAGGQLTTADVNMNGGTISIGASGVLTSAAVNMINGAQITGDTGGALTVAGSVQVTDSTVSVGDTGRLNLGDTTLDTSTLSLGANAGPSSIGNLNLTASTFSIGLNSSVTLNGNVTADSVPAPSAILGPGTLNVGNVNRTLTVGNGDGVDNVDLQFTALVGSGPAAALIKDGPGRLEFNPATGFTGTVTLQQGDTQVTSFTGPIQLAGGSLSGKGTVASIGGATPVGTVNPGNNWTASPFGILTTGAATWGPGTTFFVNLNDDTAGPGVGYDQLVVDGGVINLNGATLTGSFGAGLQLGDTFTIVRAVNGGSVVGNFAEPFDANEVFIAGQKFQVVYNRGPNGSVVLTKVLANIDSVVVTSSVNPSTVHQPVLLTATVNPEAGAGAVPTTSTVTFTLTEASSSAGPFTVTVNVGANNQAVLDTSTLPGGFLPGGTYAVTATFNGDPLNFNTGSGTLPGSQVVEVPSIDPVAGTPPYISPNQSTGVQDAFNVTTTIRGERAATDWFVEIYNDAETTLIRSIAGNGGGTGGNTVAVSAAWDGRQSPAGPFVPEGRYQVRVRFADPFGNAGQTAFVPVVVDNTNPTASALSNQNVLIAPGTGLTVPETTNLAATVGDPLFTGFPNGSFDRWEVKISNGTTVVRTFTGFGTTVAVTWDGRDDSNNIVPDAAYTATLTAFDLAGNTFSPAAQTVVVLTNPPTIALTSNTPTTYGQNITLTTTVSLPAGTPTSVTSLLANNPVEFYRGATLLGTGQLALVGTEFKASITVPTFAAGTYTNLTVRYLGTTNFLPGVSPAATHVVNKAPLTVTAANQTKVYGDPNPALTLASVTGLVLGETAANVVSGSPDTTVAAATGVGTYPNSITQGSLAANGNYQLTFVPGSFTVTPAPLTIVVNDASRPVGAVNPPFTFSAQGLKLSDTAAVVTGLDLATTATPTSPVGSYPITASGTPAAANYVITSVVPGVLSVIPVPTNVVVGSGPGVEARVNVYNTTGQFQTTFDPFPGFTGGVRTVAADFNRDGTLDIAVGTGPGTTAFFRVIDGKTGGDLATGFPFETFTGGLFLSAGDINGDGAAELVVTPDQGGGPRVVIYSGITFAPMVSYFGIDDPEFRGGARAGVGDLNNDGYADIAVSAGFQGGPRVSLWDGRALSQLQFRNLTGDFFVFDPVLRNGAYVAIGDVNGDGFGDLIAGAGPGGGPQVKVFDGKSLLTFGPAATQPFANFFAGDPNNRGGVRVAAKSLDADLKADILTGVGDGGGNSATAYLGAKVAAGQYDSLFTVADFPGLIDGVFVG